MPAQYYETKESIKQTEWSENYFHLFCSWEVSVLQRRKQGNAESKQTDE